MCIIVSGGRILSKELELASGSNNKLAGTRVRRVEGGGTQLGPMDWIVRSGAAVSTLSL